MSKHTPRSVAVSVLKYCISFGILAWLFWAAMSKDPQSFTSLVHQQKNWWLLAGSVVLCLAAVASTHLRWYLLVRALKIPFTINEALRLGFIGYLFTYLTMGVVGGDVIKAVFLARRQPGKRTEAVASVVIDRIIGLYALFLVATVGVAMLDFSALPAHRPPDVAFVKTLSWCAVGATIVGTVAVIFVSLPTFGRSPLWEMLMRLPRIGPTVARVTTAIKIYRARPRLMLLVGLMSLFTHVCATLSVYCVALGLQSAIPSLGDHFVAVPIAMVANTLPLPGGIGPFELVLNFMYRGVADSDVAENQGLIVALGYRLATIIVALIGMVYYFASRSEVSALMAEAERSAAAGLAEVASERPAS